MIYDEKFEMARKAAFRHLSHRSRTERQTTELLAGKGFDSDTINRVIDYLKKYGMLNDEAYAEYYVKKKRMRSRAVLADNLRNLGVEESTIESVLADCNSGAELRVAMAQVVGLKKRRGDDYPLVKIESFLIRRGFSSEIVEKVCNCMESMRHP